MEFWEDLSGGVKALLSVGLLLAVILVSYNACSKPDEDAIRANEAKRSVN